MNLQRVNEIIDSYQADQACSLAVLQEIQQEYNYLPREALEMVSQRLGLPRGQIYQLATFYRTFSLKPKGKHRVCVCLGTACHVHGGPNILDAFERQLGIKAGSTTPDGMFSLEAAACLGACAQAPFVRVNEEPFNQMTPVRAGEVVQDLRKRP
ncbi:MAG: NAD(P)H-dependent oxidoreductase subunit E [Thermoflexales bacterium]|nr:NAD(P)H-dependent oxidoreductase subunit E [Thermoflexales bacterium]